MLVPGEEKINESLLLWNCIRLPSKLSFQKLLNAYAYASVIDRWVCYSELETIQHLTWLWCKTQVSFWAFFTWQVSPLSSCINSCNFLFKFSLNLAREWYRIMLYCIYNPSITHFLYLPGNYYPRNWETSQGINIYIYQ